MPDQNLAYSVHILVNDRIGKQARALFYFERELTPQRHFLFHRVEIHSVADFALANQTGVVFRRQVARTRANYGFKTRFGSDSLSRSKPPRARRVGKVGPIILIG